VSILNNGCRANALIFAQSCRSNKAGISKRDPMRCDY
jgi:hypothetical protein